MPPAAELTRDQAIDALRWWVEAGVDWVVEEAPQDRFAEIAAPAALVAAPRAPATAPAARSPPTAFAEDPEALARAALEAANSASSLPALREVMLAFEGCGLKGSATQLVFGQGAAGARILLAGDVPGADDDRSGQPFSGTQGQLLDAMLGAIGLAREQVFLTQVSPWRPPGARELTAQEAMIGLAFLRRQIALVEPEFILCLGSVATQGLLGLKESFLRARGRWFDYPGTPIKAMPTLHPRDLLRRPAEKRWAWQDLRRLAGALSGA